MVTGRGFRGWREEGIRGRENSSEGCRRLEGEHWGKGQALVSGSCKSLRNGSKVQGCLWPELAPVGVTVGKEGGPWGCLRTVLVKIELACVPAAKSLSLVIYKAGSRRVCKCFCVRDV